MKVDAVYGSIVRAGLRAGRSKFRGRQLSAAAIFPLAPVTTLSFASVKSANLSGCGSDQILRARASEFVLCRYRGLESPRHPEVQRSNDGKESSYSYAQPAVEEGQDKAKKGVEAMRLAVRAAGGATTLATNCIRPFSDTILWHACNTILPLQCVSVFFLHQSWYRVAGGTRWIWSGPAD